MPVEIEPTPKIGFYATDLTQQAIACFLAGRGDQGATEAEIEHLLAWVCRLRNQGPVSARTLLTMWEAGGLALDLIDGQVTFFTPTR